MAFTTAHFIDQVTMKATLPQGRYEDSEILDVAYDVLLSHLVPLIINLKEEYYVTSESQSITANQAEYEIPYKAFGLTLREVKRIIGNQIINLIRIDPTEATTTATGTPTCFYIEGQSVILYPTPSTTEGTLKLSYYKTPSKPVLTTEAALITAIDTVTGIITATPPTDWTVNDTFDFVSRRNGNKTLGADLSATLTTTTMTFATTDIPTNLAVGDYIALAGEAPYLQIPDNGFALMVQMTANEFLEDLGDQEALQVGLSKAEQLKSLFVSAMSVRILGEPKRTRIRL